MMMSIPLNRFILLLVFPLLIISCGGIKGEFALKNPLDDGYRLVHEVPEVNADKTTEWLYRVDKPGSKPVRLLVLLRKKEVVWVEIEARSVTITQAEPHVRGTFTELEPGEYSLDIYHSEKNEKVDALPFRVYRDQLESF